MKISVIISTYNRCQSLKDTLESLHKQESDGAFEFEVIVVDNNSKDKTKEVVTEFIKKDKRFNYVFEPKQGLSNARNAGISFSRGEIVAFTDDDCVIDKDWIQNIVKTYMETNFDGMGGKILPLFSDKTHSWIKSNVDIYRGPIVCNNWGNETKIIDKPTEFPFGANLAFKKSVFYKYGLFNVKLGLGCGTMGEETDVFYRLKDHGAKLVYAGSVLVLHPVEESRLSFKYLSSWSIAYGRYLAIADRNKGILFKFRYFLGIPPFLYRQIMENIMTLLSALWNRRKFIKTWRMLFTNFGYAGQVRAMYLKQDFNVYG